MSFWMAIPGIAIIPPLIMQKPNKKRPPNAVVCLFPSNLDHSYYLTKLSTLHTLLELGSVLLETVRFLVLFDTGDTVEVIRLALSVPKGEPLVGLLHRSLEGLQRKRGRRNTKKTIITNTQAVPESERRTCMDEPCVHKME